MEFELPTPPAPTAVRDLWAQRDDELHPTSQKAWEAFQVFRDMEARSFRKVARATGLSLGTLSDYSRRYQWQVRVKAYDLSREDPGAPVEVMPTVDILSGARALAAGELRRLQALQAVAETTSVTNDLPKVVRALRELVELESALAAQAANAPAPQATGGEEFDFEPLEPDEILTLKHLWARSKHGAPYVRLAPQPPPAPAVFLNTK